MSQPTENSPDVSVADTDEIHAMPLFDGPVTTAHLHLVPGAYAATTTGPDDEPVTGTLTVTEHAATFAADR